MEPNPKREEQAEATGVPKRELQIIPMKTNPQLKKVKVQANPKRPRR
jgi:hypothetical protein